MNSTTLPSSTSDLRVQLQSLLAEHRLALACELWDSLTDAERMTSATDDERTWTVVERRLRKLESGAVQEVEHADLMLTIRRLFGWKSDTTRT
jgi:hypothetical protein